MMEVHKEFERVIDVLNEEGIGYAVCGGLALSVYGLTRATQDIDILIREETLEQVKEVLRPVGFTLNSGIIPFNSGTPEESKLYRVTKVDGTEFMILDLLLVTPVLEDVWGARLTRRIGRRDVQVVSIDGLIGMKERAGRPQDLVDVENLRNLNFDE